MNRTGKHHRGLYRSRSGMVMGACKGVAEYYGFNTGWIRFFTFALIVFTGIWPGIALYILISLLMKPEPVTPFQNDADQEFYDSFTRSRKQGLSRLKRKFDNLDRRLRRMEDIVTSRDYDWERRFNGS